MAVLRNDGFSICMIESSCNLLSALDNPAAVSLIPRCLTSFIIADKCMSIAVVGTNRIAWSLVMFAH